MNQALIITLITASILVGVEFYQLSSKNADLEIAIEALIDERADLRAKLEVRDAAILTQNESIVDYQAKAKAASDAARAAKEAAEAEIKAMEDRIESMRQNPSQTAEQARQKIVRYVYQN